MKKKYLTLVLPLSIAALSISACGITTQGSVEPSSSQPKDISVHGLNNPPLQDLLTKHFPQYNFTFDNTSLKDLIAAGKSVDIEVESYGRFDSPGYALSLGLEYDMTNLVKKSNLDLSRFEPSALHGIEGFGGLYGIPLYSDGMVLYYNKDLFDKFGVAYPKDGMTWDQVTELAKSLTRIDNGEQYVGLATLDFSHLFNSNQLSVPYVDPESGKASIGTTSWGNNWNEIFNTYFLNFTSLPRYQDYMKANGSHFPDTNAFVKSQKAAMFVYFASWSNTLKGVEGLNWDMVSMPTLKEKPGVGSQPYPGYLCISKGSKNMDDDMKIIQYLTSDEVQTELSKQAFVTVLKNDAIRKTYAEDSPFKGKNFQAVFYNQFAPMSKGSLYDQTVSQAMVKALTPVVTGDTDLNTAFNQAADQSNKTIETTKQQGVSQGN